MKETNGVLWDRTGPRLEVQNRGGDTKYRYVLKIRDLNPLRELNWCFSRWTMIRIGLWLIRRAVFARRST